MKSSAKVPTIPFFVYGTLRRGQPNYHLWQGTIVAVRPALLPDASLYDFGHYPMLAEKPGGVVHGELVWVNETHYTTVLRRLDYLEGFDPQDPDAATYRRQERLVRLPEKVGLKAWVYTVKPAVVQGLPEIAGGDWQTHTEKQREQLSAWWSAVNSVGDEADGGRSGET